MSRMQPLILILALLAGCANTATPVPALVPLEDGATSKVVLISYDGVGADALESHIAAGHLTSGGYATLASTGTSAGRVITVEPSLTVPAHISIITGASPQVSGIVSNMFHLPGTPVNERASGFAVDSSAETLWEAARRQGKQVGIVTWPGADARSSARSGDWGLTWTDPVARSRMTTLERTDFESEWLPPGWRGQADPESFSPVLRARVPWTVTVAETEIKRELIFVAQDSTDDGRENYDRIVVSEGMTDLSTDGNWFAVSTDVQQDGATYRYGSWSRVLRFDPALQETVIYWGPIGRMKGYPESYRRMIETEVGFWPSEPDGSAVGEWLAGRGGIAPEIWSEQMVRFSNFFTRATELSIARMPFDLLLAYDPTVDETEHQFLLVNDAQMYSTPENREKAADVRRLAFANFDRSIARLFGSIDKTTTALVVVSDHGLSPLDSRVAVNNVLVEGGFASQKGEMLDPASRWMAFTSGHIAHIYRFAEPDEQETARLLGVLSSLRSPDGSLIFERVELTTAQHHPNSGEVIAYTFPRFALSSSLRGETFEKTTYFGQHGGLNTHPEFHAILAAAGAGVVPGLRVPQVDQTAIARFVSSLLGIAPPAQAK